MKKQTVIYTVLTGGYDDLRQPEEICGNCDYICFSNDIQSEQIGVWQIRRLDYHHDKPVRESRFPKLNPHLVLPEYEYSLYLDANIAIRHSVYEKIRNLVKQDVSLAMIPHPERNCVYQEAMILTAWEIGEPNLIYRQTKFLLKNHFPQNHGLFTGGMIFRKHNHPDIINFSECWWNLYCRFSSRDQLGLTYALYKTHLEPEIMFPSSYYADNVYSHKKERKRIEHFSIMENCRRYFTVFRLKLLYCRYRMGSLKP